MMEYLNAMGSEHEAMMTSCGTISGQFKEVESQFKNIESRRARVHV